MVSWSISARAKPLRWTPHLSFGVFCLPLQFWLSNTRKYGRWFRNPVVTSSSIIYRVLAPSQVVGNGISSTNRMRKSGLVLSFNFFIHNSIGCSPPSTSGCLWRFILGDLLLNASWLQLLQAFGVLEVPGVRYLSKSFLHTIGLVWMSRWKLGSMVSELVVSPTLRGKNGWKTDPNLWSSLPNISAASCSLLHPIFIATRWFNPWSFSSPNVGGYQQAFKRVTFRKIPKRSQSQNCQARDIFVVSFFGLIMKGPPFEGAPFSLWILTRNCWIDPYLPIFALDKLRKKTTTQSGCQLHSKKSIRHMGFLAVQLAPWLIRASSHGIEFNIKKSSWLFVLDDFLRILSHVMKLTIFHSPPFGRNILSSIRIFSTFFLHQPKNPTATYIWSCIFLWKNLQKPLKDVGSWKGSGRMDQGGDLVRTSGLTFKTSTKTPGRQAGSSCCRWWMCLKRNRQPGAMDPTKTQVCFFRAT